MGGRLRASAARPRCGSTRDAQRRLRRTGPRRAVLSRPGEPAHELEPVGDHRAYRIALDELHDDSTSLCLYGTYRDANGEPRGGVTAPRPARGFSKDHRPDLLQLVWALTISADGAVPITYRMLDGNTEDSTTHIVTWERCRARVTTKSQGPPADQH